MFEPVVAHAQPPNRHELVNRLRVPAGLGRPVGVRQARARWVEGQAAGLDACRMYSPAASGWSAALPLGAHFHTASAISIRVGRLKAVDSLPSRPR